MSFCEGGFAKVKKFMQQVTADLESLMVIITDVTGKIKAFEGNPTIEAIVAVIPLGSQIEGYLNSAIDIILKDAPIAVSFAEKLTAWLNNVSPDEKDMKLVKLAQVATSVADNKQHPQSFYDTAVQVHIEGLK